jgi:hypothetical protein
LELVLLGEEWLELAIGHQTFRANGTMSNHSPSPLIIIFLVSADQTTRDAVVAAVVADVVVADVVVVVVVVVAVAVDVRVWC